MQRIGTFQELSVSYFKRASSVLMTMEEYIKEAPQIVSVPIDTLEKYQEMLQQHTQTQSNIDEFQAYYQAAAGEKKKRIYGLGSQANCYYASTSTEPSNAQSISIDNLDELVIILSM